MITIFHGDDTQFSRKQFLDAREPVKGAVTFDGETVTLTDVTQEIEGGGLFSDEKTIFIEELLTKRKPSKEFDAIVNFLNNASASIHLWEGKQLSKKQLSVFPKAKVHIASYPKALFQFLDNLTPNNKHSLNLFHQTLAATAPELVFFMMVRQFRLLLAVADKEQVEHIDEAKRLAPWQRGKLERQARMFPQEKLIKLYKRLYTIDLATKTGETPMNLTQSIDFFLSDL